MVKQQHILRIHGKRNFTVLHRLMAILKVWHLEESLLHLMTMDILERQCLQATAPGLTIRAHIS